MDLKYDKGKPRVDLIEPEFILGIAEALAFGASKYEADSWKTVNKGPDRYYAAAMRHILAYRKGEAIDQETGLSHLYHAACNLMFLDYYQRETDNELQSTSGTTLGDTNS